MTDNKLEKLYNKITCNGEREMTLERFREAVNEVIKPIDWDAIYEKKDVYLGMSEIWDTELDGLDDVGMFNMGFKFLKQQIEGNE